MPNYRLVLFDEEDPGNIKPTDTIIEAETAADAVEKAMDQGYARNEVAGVQVWAPGQEGTARKE